CVQEPRLVGCRDDYKSAVGPAPVFIQEFFIRNFFQYLFLKNFIVGRVVKVCRVELLSGGECVGLI
ncbi:TPA: hypothetical protein ACXEYS_005381, partial [Escherichia coli]